MEPNTGGSASRFITEKIPIEKQFAALKQDHDELKARYLNLEKIVLNFRRRMDRDPSSNASMSSHPPNKARGCVKTF